jgi:hypothetical protein
MANPLKSDPVRTLDGIRPTMAKAEVERSDQVGSSDHIGPAFGRVVFQAVVDYFGSVKAAAIALGGVALDPSFMKREFEKGRLGLLLDAEDGCKHAIGNALRVAFESTDRHAVVRRELREIRNRCDRLEELIAS